ncbi:MAG: histone deacetylase [Actinomycetota bacterium]|nr:histone deacetylase [Actinomycetota bacterium]
MRIYSDQTSALHVNHVARVEAEERFPAALAGVRMAEEGGVRIEHRRCEPVPDEALGATHDAAYLDRLRELSESGGGYLNADTGLNRHSWDAALLASGAAVGAVESALSGTPAFAVARPPGHHAGAGYGMGFCLLNHAAVAAEYARSRGLERIAIFDWDVHHGNGTQDIFYADDEVLYLSVHRSPFYPGTGGVREVGTGEGRGFTVNVPLPARSGEEHYAASFAGVVMPVLREFEPELVIVSAGYDAHAADPLGGMRLESGSFERLAAAVASLTRDLGAPPPAFVLEGGYNLEALAESVAATIKGVQEVNPPKWERDAGDAEAVEVVRRTHADFWGSLR